MDFFWLCFLFSMSSLWNIGVVMASVIVEYHGSVAMVSKMGSNGGVMVDYTRK